MKRLSIFLLVGLGFLPLRATEYIVNGDFSEGMGHWYGAARTPEDFARDNNLITPDAFYTKGVILPLKSRNWIKLAQDFQGKIDSGVMTITFKLSPDFSFSDRAEDYQNVPHEIKYDGWVPFAIDPGKWMLFIADFGSAHGTYYPLTPKAGSDVQTIRCKVSQLTPHEDKTVTLAFPPGTGNIVLLKVSFDDGSDTAPATPDPNAIPKL